MSRSSSVGDPFVRQHVNAAGVTRWLFASETNMAGDGESLESWLSKFILQLFHRLIYMYSRRECMCCMCDGL